MEFPSFFPMTWVPVHFAIRWFEFDDLGPITKSLSEPNISVL